MTHPVDHWLTILAALLSPALPAEPLPALKRLRPHLVELPARAFTAESARLVAAAERFGPVPDWGVIQRTLNAHLRATRRIEAIPYAGLPDRVLPGPDEIARVDAMLAEAGLKLDHTLRESRRAPQFPDVTLKGEQLRTMRAGLTHVPIRPNRAPEGPL